MTNDKDSGKPASDKKVERRKKMRRLTKERREQARWDAEHPIRRKSPGRRALDQLLRALDFIKK